jgi:hypothetical protein
MLKQAKALVRKVLKNIFGENLFIIYHFVQPCGNDKELIEEVEKEIMQINEDLQELKTSEYLSLQDDDDGDETDEEALKLEEGWTIDFVDVDDEDDDTFHINLGTLVKRF